MRVTAKIRNAIGERTLLRTNRAIKNDSENSKWEDPTYRDADHTNATLVTSVLENGDHMPVIDLDLPCMLVPSTKPDHYHLYINQPMSFGKMMNILGALVDAGVVQEGYYYHTLRRGYATVRYPGVTKENEAERLAAGLEAELQEDPF